MDQTWLPASATARAAKQNQEPATEDRTRSKPNASLSRRTVLGCCTAVVIGAAAGQRAAADESNPATQMLAQPGDLLVAFGEDHPKPFAPADIPKDAPPVMAWPYDPGKKLARDGSRLNVVILQRFDPASLCDTERPRAADGVVAYTAICTHQQCWVTDWIVARQVLQCPCHQSEYDPRCGAKHVGGPAPRALPALPLNLADGKLQVAGEFTDRVGGEKPSG